MAKVYICRQCRMHIPESFASGSHEEAINAPGTDIAKFITLRDYIWHLKNIHNVTLRVSSEKFDFLEIQGCDCFQGVNFWGNGTSTSHKRRSRKPYMEEHPFEIEQN